MSLLVTDFFVLPTSMPPILAHSWTMYRKRGFCGFWKDLLVSIIIPTMGAGVTGGALAIISRAFPGLEALEVKGHWVPLCCIGTMGISTYFAHKVYQSSPSWMIKTLVMHLHGASLFLSIPLTDSLNSNDRVHQVIVKRNKTIANLIASAISFTTSIVMICRSVNPILSGAAGYSAFIAVAAITFRLLPSR